VEEREASERYDRLLANLVATRELLATYQENHWLTWMEAVHREVRAGDGHGLARLLQAYGGMGSFNDVYLHPSSAEVITQDQLRRDNDRLEKLRSQMWSDATALRQSLNRGK
jgi:hypothetical protein